MRASISCVDCLVGSRPRPAARLRWAPAFVRLGPWIAGLAGAGGAGCCCAARSSLRAAALLLFPFAFLATLFGFHYILAQFAIGAEQAAVGDDKFRFLSLFLP